MNAYALTPHAFDSLYERTGRTYKFLAALAGAKTEKDARKYANEKSPKELGIDWEDEDLIACFRTKVVGTPPPEGYVHFSWTEET